MIHQQQSQWQPKHVNKLMATGSVLLISALCFFFDGTYNRQSVVHHSQKFTHPMSMCFDNQPSDVRTMARLMCNDTLPQTNYDHDLLVGNNQEQAVKPPSSVAICVIGKTRSFDSILAQESLRTNIALAFGASHTAFYFHLFPRDKRGDSTPRFSAEHGSTVQDSLEAALRVVRMKEQDFVFQQQTHQEQHHWVSESCGAEIVIDNREDELVFQSNMENYQASKPEAVTSHRINSVAYWKGAINQWTGIKDCYDFVQRQEEQMGYKFDYVIRTRPDMAYSRSIYPNCMFSQRNIWSAHDWTFVFPRKVMDFLHKVYNEGVMTNSNPAFALLNESIEGHMFRMLNLEIESRQFSGTEKCCDEEWVRTLDKSIRKDDMVGGATLLRPRGPGFPRNICHSMGAGALLSQGQDLGFDPCMDQIQYNKYNVPSNNVPFAGGD